MFIRRAVPFCLFALLILTASSSPENLRAVDRPAITTATCHDGIYEDGEFCGHDAFVTSGIPDMNHDCVTDALDMILFIPGFYSGSPSGDFNGDSFTGYDDLIFLRHRLGVFASPCNSVPVPNDVVGSIALSFSTNPATIDDNDTVGLVGSHMVWVVVDNIAGAKAIEYAVETSTNVILIDHFATTTSEYTSACAEDSLKSLVISLPAPLGAGPQVIAGIQYHINDGNPGTVKIVGSVCAGRVRWFGADLAFSHHFGTIANAGINGSTPGPTPPTDNTPPSLVGLVTGSVYADAADDCTFNGPDYPVADRVVEVNPGEHLVHTNDNGVYWFWLEPGDYTVKLQDGANDPWRLTACQAATTEVTVTAGNLTTGPAIALIPRGQITGTVYRDYDANCALNSPDYAVAGRMIEVNPGGYLAFTDYNGGYSVNVPQGAYTVTQATIANDLWALQPCSPASHSVTVAAGANASDNNFALIWTGPNLCKVSVAAYSNGVIAYTGCPGSHPWRTPCPGLESEYVFAVMADKKSTDPVAAGSILTLTLDPAYIISTVTSNVAFSTVGSTANERIIQFTDEIKPGQVCVVTVHGTPNPNSGSLYVTTMDFDSGGCTGVQTASIQDYVQCSCDPNDMHVAPPGCGPNGEIVGNAPFTYRVRFENVGPGAAHNIFIKDVLDADLDLNSLRILKASHPVTGLQIDPGNELVIRFDGIELAGKGNPGANKGFVLFMIDPKPNLANGTTIQNTAAITFDYNVPVITNTVLNTIQAMPCHVTGVDPRVPGTNSLGQNYPNPFNPTTTIGYGLASQALVTISVYDINGKLVRTLVSDTKPAGRYTVDWDGRNQAGNSVASGVYLSRMSAGSFVETKKLVLLK
jgi:hypothetical protein